MVKTDKIYQVENFIPSAVCDSIVKWFKEEKRLEINEGNSLFDNRTIPYASIKDNWIKQQVNGYRFDITVEARKLYGTKLYPDYTDLVYWPTGMSMDVHADAVWLDGTPAVFPYRFCAGVCYLNDDYEGGETYFPRHNKEVAPKKGKIVLFPSTLEYQHGVRKVIGERYTMPIWFSKDKNNLET